MIIQRIHKSRFRMLLAILFGFLLALVIVVVGWFLFAWIGLANIIINIMGVSYAAYNTSFLLVFVAVGVAFSFIINFDERKHDVMLQEVTPTAEMIRSMEGRVCASCGKRCGFQMIQPNEQFYEVYPDYRGRTLCLVCARQYQCSALYHKRLKDSQGRAIL